MTRISLLGSAAASTSLLAGVLLSVSYWKVRAVALILGQLSLLISNAITASRSKSTS